MSNENTQEKHPAVQVAHVRAENKGADDGVVTLSTGYRANIVPVSAALIDEVTAKVKDPKVPMWMNEEKGREEPNPSDPDYLEARGAAEHRRGVVAMDALIMFGVELVDPVPTDGEWIRRLRFLGVEIDPEDPFETEFFFKKYVAVASDDIELVTRKSGMTAEAVAEAERSFRRSAT